LRITGESVLADIQPRVQRCSLQRGSGFELAHLPGTGVRRFAAHIRFNLQLIDC